MKKIWFAQIKRKKIGPLSEDELAQMIKEETVKDSDFVWCPGMNDWGLAGRQVELKQHFELVPPPFKPASKSSFVSFKSSLQNNVQILFWIFVSIASAHCVLMLIDFSLLSGHYHSLWGIDVNSEEASRMNDAFWRGALVGGPLTIIRWSNEFLRRWIKDRKRRKSLPSFILMLSYLPISTKAIMLEQLGKSNRSRLGTEKVIAFPVLLALLFCLGPVYLLGLLFFFVALVVDWRWACKATQDEILYIESL